MPRRCCVCLFFWSRPRTDQGTLSRIQGLLDVPVPKVTGGIPVFVGVWEEIVDAIQLVPQEQVFEECVQNRVPELIMDSSVPQLTEAVVEVIPQERVQNRTLERTVVSPVPQIMEEIVESVQLVDVGFPVPQITEDMGERVQDRTPELGILVPQIVEEVPVDIVLSTPQERAQNLVGEQIVGVPVPQVMEEGLHLVPQERVLKCTPEQLVDVPVPRIMEAIVEKC